MIDPRDNPLLKTTRTRWCPTHCVLLTSLVLGLVRIASADSDTPATSEAWPTLSADDQQAAITQLKAFADQAAQQTDPPLTLHETDFFLFYTDLPPREARNWASLLDKMYRRLCRLFALPEDENIWRGKALLFVYRNQQDFIAFETEHFDYVPGPNTAGLCHTRSDGNVTICFYRQDNQWDFAQVLVHEAVHGFLHRYRSPARIASWVNEGLAEVISAELVPKSRQVASKRRYALKLMKHNGNLGSSFFTAEHISGWQYGVAASLTDFMIRKNKSGYVAFVNGIKAGTHWRQSLEENYGTDIDRLVAAFGRSLRIRSLEP